VSGANVMVVRISKSAMTTVLSSTAKASEPSRATVRRLSNTFSAASSYL
jgi:hypothetical protein